MFRKVVVPFASRPRLLGAAAFGVAVSIGLSVFARDLSWSTRAVAGWDCFCAGFITLTVLMMGECGAEKMKARAATQDEGQHFILGLALVAAVASIIAVAAELTLAKGEHGLLKSMRVLAAFFTVCASWFFIQLVFALHYAHEFYSPGDGVEDHQGGLNFPGEDAPDYWDFLHFAAIIGVAAQTADVAFTARGLRRTGTVHGVFAFFFNTVVLALTINLLAGLF